MKNFSIYLISAFFLFSLVTNALSGTYQENFESYTGCDPFQSSAHWDTFNHCLKIHETQKHGFLLCEDSEPHPVNGTYFLLIEGLFNWNNLRIVYYDDNGFAVWPEQGIIVSENPEGFIPQMTVLTNGELLVIWSEDDDVTKILSQRYTSAGDPVWPEPVRVNDDVGATYVSSADIAALPGGESIIIFIDDRAITNYKLFAQRLSSSGNRVWPNDVEIQPSLSLSQYQPDVQTDSTGRIFVSWEQYDLESDIAFTEIEMDGNIVHDPGIMIPNDTTNNESAAKMAIVNDDAIYFTWFDKNGISERIEMNKRAYDGSPLWSDDHALIISLEPLHQFEFVAQTNNTFLCNFNARVDDFNHIVGFAVDHTGAYVSSIYTIENGNYENFLTAFQLCPNTNGGGTVVNNHSRNITSIEQVSHIHKLGIFSQPLWPDPITICKTSGDLFHESIHLSKLSGNQGGFKSVWIDDRTGTHHIYGCNYQNPIQPTGIPTRLDSFAGSADSCKSIQASDGSTVLLFAHNQETNRFLSAEWYDADWNSLWTEPLRIQSWGLYNSLSDWDLLLDSQERCVVIWSPIYDVDTGIFFQTFTKNGEILFEDPKRINPVSPATYFLNISAVSLDDGSLVFTWMDDATGDITIWAQRVSSSGDAIWPSPLALTSMEPSSVSSTKLIRTDGGNMLLVAGTFTNSGIYRFIFSDDGILTHPGMSISSIYDQVRDVAAEVINGHTYVLWIGIQDHVTGIYAEKLVNGSPVWIDKKLNGLIFDYISNFSIVKTGLDTIAILFNGIQDPDIYSLIQEMHTDGTTTYTTSQRFFQPEPAVYHVEEGVSAQLNSGENVNWCQYKVTDTLNAGYLVYWLTNDGGTSWHRYEPGHPFVFPSPGSDLRWGVDLYSDQYFQSSPILTSVDIQWNETPVAIDLILNQKTFRSGDTFNLSIRHVNSSTAIDIEKYILLDVYGEYWFWPGWTQIIDYNAESIPVGITEEMILEFTWPSGAGSASELCFWAALLEPGTANLVGPLDMVEFEYE